MNNLRIFNDLGHDVYVLSFGGKYREEDKILNDYSYDNILYKITNDIDTHSWKERFLRYIYPYSNARRVIKETISDYDMLIAYNTTFQMNLFLQRICKQHGKKLVLDLTEWPAANETLGGKWCPIYWMSELNMRFVQKRFKNMIPISQFLNSYYSADLINYPTVKQIKDILPTFCVSIAVAAAMWGLSFFRLSVYLLLPLQLLLGVSLAYLVYERTALPEYLELRQVTLSLLKRKSYT